MSGEANQYRQMREGIETLIHTQRILKSEMPYGSPSYSNRGHLEAEARIQAYSDVLQILDACYGVSEGGRPL